MIQNDHVFIDLETSSLDATTGEIIEVAAIRTDCKANILATYTDKIQPTKPVEESAARLNHYTKESWANAVPFLQAMDGLTKTIIGDRGDKVIVVAHFAEFDRSFLNASCDRYNIKSPFAGRGWICTGQLVWPLAFCEILHSRKLQALCDYFKVENDAPHTAMGDVTATAQVYWKIMRRMVPVFKAESAIHGSQYGGVLEQIAKVVTGL